MQTRKDHKKRSEREREGKHSSEKCGLIKEGICHKIKCSNQFHKNIKMDIHWIQNNVLLYIKEMLRLEVTFSVNFSGGAFYLLKTHPHFVKSIPISEIVKLYEVYMERALFFAKLLDLIPNGLSQFMNLLGKHYNRSMFDSLKKILKHHKQNLEDYPMMQEQIHINSVFVYVRRSRDELQDSLMLGLYQYYRPEARRMFLRKLQAEYGDDYYLIRKIQNDYHLPSQSKTEKKKDYSKIRANRATVLNDRSNGYELPSDVTICYINNIRTLRMEVVSMVQEKVLGWDSEWFAPVSRPQYPHLLQISGRKRVWIIDGIWLKQNASEELNGVLGILTNAKWIFHIFKGKEDIQLIKQLDSYPCFKQMELCVDVDRILDHLGFTMCSLAAETAFFLGKKLIKKDTMTDWTQRPLDQSQLYYAALDAFATRKIYLKAAYLILNNVPLAKVTKNMEDYKQTRRFEKKNTLDFPYRVVSSDSLDRFLKESAVLCEDYLESSV